MCGDSGIARRSADQPAAPVSGGGTRSRRDTRGGCRSARGGRRSPPHALVLAIRWYFQDDSPTPLAKGLRRRKVCEKKFSEEKQRNVHKVCPWMEGPASGTGTAPTGLVGVRARKGLLEAASGPSVLSLAESFVEALPERWEGGTGCSKTRPVPAPLHALMRLSIGLQFASFISIAVLRLGLNGSVDFDAVFSFLLHCQKIETMSKSSGAVHFVS
jgi:hypothetical protein